MTYQPFLLTEELHLHQIITIHYFEYTNTYHFHGESHDFWEFLCVDKGEVTVTAGRKKTEPYNRDRSSFMNPMNSIMYRQTGKLLQTS